ncbi:hypothetical protein PNC41_06145 [Enterococcus faecium]|uniref:hypothetical protein n=1 Tax=Enterococcus faecium TaxID=1352 RepID=UPI000CF3318B|nr:hypothetical protein [Enterococcus faecium]MDB7512034.1 hypothetical protein [Enterococcus faecium]MDB7514586.1 hypothetical protein [Enterococcus faecium]MDW2984626.1 hypothetical protein [Enterococcus faecium]MDW3029944.1 hypothetical protein [Enterococcus faecium]PQG64943.1 hypothetical protein CUS28_05470 [Enterococcus faecium]
MISVKGLGDEIFEAMMNKAQRDVQEKILTAASYGQTSCTIRSKGLTPSFLAALESEGISNIQCEDGSVKLFWDF